MRICYLLNGFGFTGGSIVVYNIMNKLCENGYEVYAVTPHTRVKWEVGKEKDILESNRGISKKNIKKNIKQMIVSNKLANSIYKMIKERDGDQDRYLLENRNIIKNWIECDYTIATLFTTAYAAYELSDYTIPLYHMQHYEELFVTDNPHIQKVARASYGLPINLISNSSWLKSEIEHRFNRKTYLLNPAVSDEHFFCRNDIEEKYGNVSVWKILNYSDARDFKALNDNIKTMKAIKQKYKDKVEIIYFGGHDPKDIGFEYKYVGKVFGEELGKLYSDAHILFLPSWYESFPLQPLEAQKSGTMVVSTRYGTEDYLNGTNSIVVLPRQIDQMIDAIERIIDGKINVIEVVKTGLETSKQFTWQKTYERFIDILEDARKNNIAKKFADVNELLRGEFRNYRNY